MKQGASGKSVIMLQARLSVLLSKPNIVLDGDFGPKTDSLVKEYQTSKGLIADGIVGKSTTAKIKSDYENFKRVMIDKLMLETKNSSQTLGIMGSDSNSIKDKAQSLSNAIGVFLEKAANSLEIDTAVLYSILLTESGGDGFKNNRLIIRFENHWFWKQWGKRNQVKFLNTFTHDQNSKTPWLGHHYMSNGVKTGVHKSQNDEWAAFTLALALNKDAAIKSISMGAAQIMGFHYEKLLYDTPEKMLEFNKQSIENQLKDFFKFIIDDPRLYASAKSMDWRTFAEYYNGSGQIDKYSGWLEKRYKISNSILKL